MQRPGKKIVPLLIVFLQSEIHVEHILQQRVPIRPQAIGFVHSLPQLPGMPR